MPPLIANNPTIGGRYAGTKQGMAGRGQRLDRRVSTSRPCGGINAHRSMPAKYGCLRSKAHSGNWSIITITAKRGGAAGRVPWPGVMLEHARAVLSARGTTRVAVHDSMPHGATTMR